MFAHYFFIFYQFVKNVLKMFHNLSYQVLIVLVAKDRPHIESDKFD